MDNPNFYEDSVGRQVWANLLTGTWAGQSSSGTPVTHASLSTAITATAAGRVTGTFSVGGAPAGTLRGTIHFNTTTVRGTGIFGGDNSPTPISGIRIEFTWAMGSEAGKGRFESRGGRRLVGSWGQGGSRTDRGNWDINHSQDRSCAI